MKQLLGALLFFFVVSPAWAGSISINGSTTPQTLASGSLMTVVTTDLALCGVNPVSVKSGNWSDPATWDGCVPTAKDHATIASGHIVTIDGAVTVTEVLVNGQLSASRTRDSTLDVGSVVVFSGGVLDYGTVTNPIPVTVAASIALRDIPDATYTHLHGQPKLQPVLHAHGGRIEMHGSGPMVPWMPLMGNVSVGSKTLTLAEDLTGWKAGDTILVTGTVKRAQQTEERIVAAIDPKAKKITLSSPLTYAHGGIMPTASCRTCRQAVVANLTRNVSVRSATPATRRGHVHFATNVLDSSTGTQPIVHIADVAFLSLGRPEAGVYGGPHLHMMGVAKDAYVKRNVIRDSANVWVRVHNTHFATISDNIGYESVGNGFSTEDGTEAYNVFDHNLAVHARRAVVKTNPFDQFDTGDGAGFWANTPRNIWTRNLAVENIWGFQIQRGGEGDPTPVMSVDAMGTPTMVDVRTATLLRFDENIATGSASSGFEMAGGRSTEDSLINHFTALDNTGSSVAVFSFNTVFDHLYAHNGGEGDLKQNNFRLLDVFLYLGQLNITIRNSYVSAMEIGYQNVGYVLLENVQLDQFVRSAFGAAETVISIAGPTASKPIPYDVLFTVNGVVQPGTTATQHVILWNYDGPGQHVMLGQDRTSAVDGLTYKRTTRFTRGSYEGNMNSTWQEARFTGPYGQGPPFTWPLLIDVGNRPRGGLGQPNPTDRIIDGRRWRVDVPYIPSPPGMRLSRYGFSGTFPVYTPVDIVHNPTEDPTNANLNDGTLMASNRTARQLKYTVDVPNGEYWVDLGWQESGGGSVGSAGERLMDVVVQGVRHLTDFDVFQLAGANRPLWRSFPATVANERLTVELGKPNTGFNAMLSAMAVCPKAMVSNGRCTPEPSRDLPPIIPVIE